MWLLRRGSCLVQGMLTTGLPVNILSKHKECSYKYTATNLNAVCKFRMPAARKMVKIPATELCKRCHPDLWWCWLAYICITQPTTNISISLWIYVLMIHFDGMLSWFFLRENLQELCGKGFKWTLGLVFKCYITNYLTYLETNDLWTRGLGHVMMPLLCFVSK